jgi:cytochrome P450
VPNRFSDELRNNPALSLSKGQKKEFPTQYTGFEGMREGLREDGLMLDVINAKLTPSLGLLTEVLVQQTAVAIEHTLGEKSEWGSFNVKDVSLDITARVSGRVFAGDHLARDEHWLAISKEYTIRVFGNGVVLNLFPPLIRPLMYQILPSCRELRKQVKDARKLLEPEAQKVINQRKESKESEERPTKNTSNCFAWMLDVARGRPLDFTGGQLLLSLAAMNTTTEVTTRCLLQICDTPDIVQPLRTELVNILTEFGWTRSSLQKLKLMDSFLREVLRVHPLASGMYTTDHVNVTPRPSAKKSHQHQ